MPSQSTARRLAAGACSIAAIAATAVTAAPASAATPTVDVMVTGSNGLRIAGPKRIMPGQTSFLITKSGTTRRCSVAAASPLAALKLAGLSIGLTDYGKCGSKPADGASLFVSRIGSKSGSGLAGWNYKVGNRAGTAGAADPAGPFGSGLLKTGNRVLWFWCVYDPETYACQRTLSLTAPTTVAPGHSMTVSVKAYDDQGRGVPAAGVQVSGCGTQSALTGDTGTVVLAAPGAKGSCTLNAADVTDAARPAAFPAVVKVG